MAEEILTRVSAIPPKDKAEEIVSQQKQMYFIFLTPESTS